MNPFLCICASLLLLPCLLDAQVIRKRVPASSFETVTLLYTANTRGLHASTQTNTPASALQTIISALRAEYKNSLLLDLGNFMGATPPTVLTRGRLDFQVMELLGYDLVHISSDDFIIGAENLNKRIAETKVPVMAGNLEIAGSTALRWTILSCGNRKVGLIGLTSRNFENLVIDTMRQDVVVEPAAAYIARAIKDMTGKADIIVALTDLADDEIAQIRDIPGLDIVITTGGNSAKPGSDWVSVGFPGTKSASIVRTLSTDTAVHLLEIHGYPDQNKWTVDEIVGDVYKVTKGTPRENATENWFRWQIDNYAKTNNMALGELKEALPNDKGRERQTALGKAVTDLMRTVSRSHLAFLSSGSLRGGLPKGPVTEWDLIEAVPYPNNLVEIQMTGAQIESVISKSQGKSGESGYLQFSGLSTEPAILGNRIGGLQIVPERFYTITLLDFLAQGGEGYDEFKTAKVVKRFHISLQDLCRTAFKDHGSLVVNGLPLDREGNFWYKKFQVAATVNGFIADPTNLRLYPNEWSLIGQQLLATSVNSRLDVARRTFVSGLDNFIDVQYATSWDRDWAQTETLDTLQIGSQYSIYLSNLLFGGVKTLDPYISTVFGTALLYPDPSNWLFDPSLPRPGSLKVAGGMELTLLKLMSLKLGVRWEAQPYDWSAAPITGLESILAFKVDIIRDMLSFDTTTDVFSAFNFNTQGITISSVNNLSLALKDNLTIGPRVQLFYNTRVNHWAYLFDAAVTFSLTL